MELHGRFRRVAVPGAGEEFTQTYTVTIHDGAGGSVSEEVVITLTGTNDDPAITGAVIAGTVTADVLEDAASGTIDFADVDIADTHMVSVTPAGDGYLGTLTASISNPSTGDGSGQVAWSFAVDAAALQFLAADQQLTQTYTIAIDDGAGGIVTQDVTVTTRHRRHSRGHRGRWPSAPSRRMSRRRSPA